MDGTSTGTIPRERPSCKRAIQFVCFAVLALVTALDLVIVIVFCTPLSTAAAEYLWRNNDTSAAPLILVLDERDAQLAFDVGSYAFGLGAYDLPLAEHAFRRVVAIDPSMLWGHYELARILLVENRLPEAEAAADGELSYHPDNFRTYYVRGLIRAYRGDLAGAESDFTTFVSWAPTEWAGYNDLAWVLGQEGKYAEAKTLLERGVTMATGGEENPWLWNNLGVQELNLNEFAVAANAFERAQTLAAGLTEASWVAAYPGNDPAMSAAGIKSFQDAIAVNLARARVSGL
ncbi:MAG TPA: tetratricopeptide repeat protein [Candidatus Paceibacterota bacterium]|nr:tetratricopeptide repeat protein [Candidatus Paceibacterota bacterium]